MAYITIHPIKTTLKKAIDYICDPKKTDNQKNISTQYCLVPTADKMFQFTKERHYSNVKTLAFHIIQSFKRGEVTPEQAQAIGVETMKRIFGDKYEYIVATHNDTGIIHNHIIVNSVNMINGKAFSTEHDRKSYPAWKKICNITNNIAKEYGLSTAENALHDAQSKGKSHYEWSMDKQGKSWKSQLKSIIDETIRNVDDFDGFLYRLREQNITVKYEPYKTKEGMILAFKMDGQKNFIYSKSLGKYYHENTIKERIERCVKRRGMSRTERRMERILNDDGKLKKLYDVESFSERGLQEWAKDENRKIRNKTLCELHDRGFSSSYELDRYLEQLYTTLDEYSRAYDVFSTKKAENEVLLKYVKIYNEYKDIYDYYKNKTYYPDRYFRVHEKEILLFEEAKSQIYHYREHIPDIEILRYEIKDDARFLDDMRIKYREMREELYSYETLKYNLDDMYSKFPSEAVSAEQMTYSDIFDRFRYKPDLERTRAYESEPVCEKKIMFDENNYEYEVEDEPEREPVRAYDSYYDRGYEYDTDCDSNCDRERTQEYEPETPSRKPPKRNRSDDFDMEL